MATEKKVRKPTAAQKAKREEYSRLRGIARKRIERAHEMDELLDEEVPPSLKDIKNTRQLNKELKKVRSFLDSLRSTVKGREELQRRRMDYYKSIKYENINPSNEKKFQRFMKHMIKKYKENTPDGKKRMRDSDSFATFFDELAEEDKIHERTRLSDLVRMYNKWVGSIL